jgi:uncharacterized protein (DUF849 family)
MSDKVVITCALTGVLARREQCPWVPYTPVEIAEEARRRAEHGLDELREVLARRKDFVFKAVFENSFDTIIELLRR